MPRTVTLDAESERLIESLMRDGRYASAEEAVRDALRALEAEEAMLEGLDVEAIRRSIEENRRDGALLTEEEVFGPLEAKYRAVPERAGE
ncbi:MAG: type II toxin-antitoxin system ParD family antitoxin [Acetobacteraceae bacterium]|nr:type II toxin-antitoxin system ParD family antitoxin [Acetobacteraceae bacterium]